MGRNFCASRMYYEDRTYRLDHVAMEIYFIRNRTEKLLHVAISFWVLIITSVLLHLLFYINSARNKERDRDKKLKSLMRLFGAQRFVRWLIAGAVSRKMIIRRAVISSRCYKTETNCVESCRVERVSSLNYRIICHQRIVLYATDFALGKLEID